MADEEREMFVSGVTERIDGPKGRVNDAEQGAERVFAVGIGVGQSPVEQTACDCSKEGVGHCEFGRGADGGGNTGGVFPDDSRCSVRANIADVSAGGIEKFEVAIEMVGEQVAADG